MSGTAIRKAYLYGDRAGTEFLDYEEFAVEHVQDAVVARELAESLLAFGISENFDEAARVFEVYTVKDRDALVEQIKEYEDEEEA